MSHTPLTVTILTKNEELLIERCIDSVRWADEILVLDSGSTDRTRELAAARGAVVHEQAWLGWTPQRQRAIALASNDWVLIVEADEIVTPELARSIQTVLGANPDPADGFSVDRRDELLGRLLPTMRRRALLHSFVRMFNRTRSHYNPAEVIHETVIVTGRCILLVGALLHWRNVVLADQLEKDVGIARLEADLMTSRGEKSSLLKIVLMPLLRFFWCYLWMGAIRVGAAGFLYSLMRAHGEFLRQTVLWERQHVRPATHPPADVWKASDMPAGRAVTSPPSPSPQPGRPAT